MWNLKKTMGFAVRFVVDNGACTGGLDVVNSRHVRRAWVTQITEVDGSPS